MQQIGRYEFNPLQIVATQQIGDEYEVTLPYGTKLMLNAEEKKKSDEVRELHKATMYAYGVARAAGLRG